MSWSVLLPILLQLVGQYFGPLVKKLIENLLPKTGEVPVSVMAAPSGLKDFLIDFLSKQAQTRLEFNPILKAIALAFINQLGVVVDMVWDKLFSQNLVTVKMTASPQVSPQPIDCPPETEGLLMMEFGG